MRKKYIPDAGDIVRIQNGAPRGGSAAPTVAVVILSPAEYNRKTGLLVCCPITNHIKGYPFEVPLAPDHTHAALADQAKSLGWGHARLACEGQVHAAELAEIRAKLQALLLRH